MSGSKFQISMICTVYWLNCNIDKERNEIEKRTHVQLALIMLDKDVLITLPEFQLHAFSELLITESHICIFPSSGFLQWQTSLSSDDNFGQGTRWIRILIKLFHSCTFIFMELSFKNLVVHQDNSLLKGDFLHFLRLSRMSNRFSIFRFSI